MTAKRRDRLTPAAWTRVLHKYTLPGVLDLSAAHPHLRAWVLELSADHSLHAQVRGRLERRAVAVAPRFEGVMGIALLDLFRHRLRARYPAARGRIPVGLIERLTIDSPLRPETFELPEDSAEARALDGWLAGTFYPAWADWCVNGPGRPPLVPAFLAAFNTVRAILVEHARQAAPDSLLKYLRDRYPAGGPLTTPHVGAERTAVCETGQCPWCEGWIALPARWQYEFPWLQDTPEELATVIFAAQHRGGRALSTAYRKLKEDLALARQEFNVFQQWTRYGRWLADHPDAAAELHAPLGFPVITTTR